MTHCPQATLSARVRCKGGQGARGKTVRGRGGHTSVPTPTSKRGRSREKRGAEVTVCLCARVCACVYVCVRVFVSECAAAVASLFEGVYPAASRQRKQGGPACVMLQKPGAGRSQTAALCAGQRQMHVTHSASPPAPCPTPPTDSPLIQHITLPRRTSPGDVVFMSSYALGRSPALWDDPLTYNPARFSPEAEAARHRFQFLPFGAGARMCLGAGFAQMSVSLMVATLLQRLRFEPVRCAAAAAAAAAAMTSDAAQGNLGGGVGAGGRAPWGEGGRRLKRAQASAATVMRPGGFNDWGQA
jgi:hypothetical protein